LYISQNAALAGTGPVVVLVAFVEEESADVLSADAERVSVHDIAAHIATNARIDTNCLQGTVRLDSPSPPKAATF
jgi:hypothetical protein